MSFNSNFENACKVITATRAVANSYNEVHFWENPTEKTFNYKLCRELGLTPDKSSVKQILILVEEWNIHQTLKGLYRGEFTSVFPFRK